MLELAHAGRAPQMRLAAATLYLALTLATVGGNAVGGEVREVVYTTTPEALKGYLCRPSGAGPFPAVVYNHGGVSDIIGGAPKETCEALAAEVSLGSPPSVARRARWPVIPTTFKPGSIICWGSTISIATGVAMAGFSRGGALTFMAARGAPRSRRR